MDIRRNSSILRILLVEDNDHDAIALERTLKQSSGNIQIQRFTQAKGVLDHLWKGEYIYDAVLVDHKLPGKSGMDLCLELVQNIPDTPIILMTGVGDEKLAVTALKAGIADYLTKDNSGGYLDLLPLVIQEAMGKKQDLLEKRQTQFQLLKAKQEAEAANEAKNRFLATISHELRTPLNAITGMIDLVLSTDLTPSQREYLETAWSATGEMGRLVNDLIDFAGIETGRLEIIEKDFVIRRFLDRLLKSLFFGYRHKKIDYRIEVDPQIPEMIYGPQDRLRQILSNMLDNAIKFTREGNVTLRVNQAVESEKEIILKFSVIDTGIGIPPDKLQKIFERFTQGDSSTTRQYGGLGLGASIAQRLVVQMGGRIWVESKVHQGSAFHFTVRVKPGKETALANPKEKPLEKKGLQVLLAEDNPFNQKLVMAILNMRGHEITVARNGKEAVAAFGRASFDMILMDIQMPEMDGFEATMQIRNQEKKKGLTHTPIIAMTAHVMEKDRDLCFSAGMDAFISKPIRREEFLSLVENLAQDHQKKKESEGVCGDAPLPGVDEDRILDKNFLMNIVGGNSDLIEELLQIYQDNLPKLLDQIREGIETENGDTLRFGAHALKGMSLNLSAKAVADIALKLENYGKSGDIESAVGCHGLLKQEITRLEVAMEHLLEELKG